MHAHGPPGISMLCPLACLLVRSSGYLALPAPAQPPLLAHPIEVLEGLAYARSLSQNCGEIHHTHAFPNSTAHATRHSIASRPRARATSGEMHPHFSRGSQTPSVGFTSGISFP